LTGNALIWPIVEADRALDRDIAAVGKLIEFREIPVLN